jgi:hypothetical protein
VARHQANHARIQSLRAEANALQEQLKTSVSALASLRHELFETPATIFPADSRPVRLDELLQYAKNISPHTVPPTYRERAPPAAADKDDAASSAPPTNGVNTPANAPDAMDITKDTPQEPKEGGAPESAPLEVTAEEEEWLKKLNDDKKTWYPWPSYEKIRQGNLYKLMYWQAKGKKMDEFNIHAYEEVLQGKDLPVEEVTNPELEAAIQGAQGQQQAPAPRVRGPAPPQKIFEGFQEFDD